jgi:photosystem II stability/assembly factor-like uncharacterized protein
MRRAAIVVLLLVACSTQPPAAPASLSVATSAAPRPAAAPAPPGPAFVPLDIAFPSATTGYALSRQGLRVTADGGRTWHGLPAVPAQVRHVRFSDGPFGYLWGPDGVLWGTADSGRTWSRTPLRRTVDVTIAAGAVVAVAAHATDQDVWSQTLGGSTWTDLGRVPGSGTTLAASPAGALVLGQSRTGPVLTLAQAARQVARAALPCPAAQGAAPGSARLGSGADGPALLACIAHDATGTTRTASAWLSADGALTWSPVDTPPGLPAGLLAAGPTLLAWGSGLFRSTGSSWSTSLRGDITAVQFPSARVGFALDASGALHGTADAGASWSRLTP